MEHLTHLDDVAWEEVDRGELRWRRQRLGRAAGSAGVGLSRYLVPPGGRLMPAHAHVDEEEIVVVLAGAGVSWQDGTTYAIAAGDALVHPADGPAHTLVARDAGLEVLVFGSGSPTGLTRLPRARVLRVGGGLWPPEAGDALAAELEAGPLAPPPPTAARPATIGAVGGVPGRRTLRGATDVVRRDVGRALGSRTCGLTHLAVAAGAEGHPPHAHSIEEEVFVVRGGDGMLVLGDDERPLTAGSVVARPPGTGVAHGFRAGADGLELLAFGTRAPGDLCWYPRSRKVALRGLGVILRAEPVGYWEGEA